MLKDITFSFITRIEKQKIQVRETWWMKITFTNKMGETFSVNAFPIDGLPKLEITEVVDPTL